MMVKSEGIEDALFRYALKSDKENRGLDALTRHVIDEEIKREIATAMQAAVESREAQEKLTLSGTDLKSRIASFRQQAGLIN
jgi:predicted  nucleic acid-binding Zn-ribbon protein